MKNSLLMVGLAGTCLASAALAQNQDYPVLGKPELVPAQGLTFYPPADPFSQRAVGYVWDNTDTPWDLPWYFLGMGNARGNKAILMASSFTPGPWANGVSRTITACDFGLTRNGVATVTFDIEMTFYNLSDINLDGAGAWGPQAVNPAAVPLRVGYITGWNLPGANLYWYAGVGLPGGPIVVPDGELGVGVQLRIGTYDANTLTFTQNPVTGVGAFFLASGTCTPSAGNTLADFTDNMRIGGAPVGYGRDWNNDGLFDGNATPVNAGGQDHQFSVFGTPPAQAAPYTWYQPFFSIQGDIVGSSPTAENVALGADGVWVSDSEAMGDDGVKWYEFSLNGDAIDTNLTYLDLSTDGSTANVGVALYDATGTLIAYNNAGGPGDQGQLSFGIGRRAAIGDGDQFDGRNYFGAAPGLPAGQYYAAVFTDSGCPTLANAFTAVGRGTGGNATLKVRTNVTGGTNDPSVAPVATRLTGQSGEDPIVAPGGASAVTPIAPNFVLWHDVQLCRAADINNAVTFQFDGTDTTVAMHIFDSNGNQVGEAHGAGGAGTPAVTFGGGVGPDLAPGTYYVAFHYDATQIAPDPANNGRWHVRGLSGNNGFGFQLTVTVPWFDCPTGGGCDADVNCDGSPDQGDVACMILAVAGDTSCICQDPDFNLDGSADQGDVAAIILVVAGAPCP